jgi:hypothetical protein
VNRVVLVVVLLGSALVAATVVYLLTSATPSPAARTATREVSAAAPRGSTAEQPVAPEVPPPSATPSTPELKRGPRSAKAAPEAPAAPETPAAPTTATLRIVSDVPGAQVFLNREFVGAAPTTAADLTPGEYQLNVSAPGYDNHVVTIALAPGEREVVVNFREVRLAASLEVIHKHRLGSCKGRLIATPQGLRYETTDKNDAFSASLLDLETFQVDYLDKNLRVQPRKGKRYDFTDPEANADRLFVFHRDVERARERLKKGDRPSGF